MELVRNRRKIPLRRLAPLGGSVAVGTFLSVASHALSWSGTLTLAVGCVLVAVLAFVGTPLLLLDDESLDRLRSGGLADGGRSGRAAAKL
jgi:hypothetical protein